MTDSNQQPDLIVLINQMQAINAQLKQIRGLLEPKDLGFCESPYVRRLYCNTQYSNPDGTGCLYTWNGAINKPEIIPHTAIRFLLKKVEIEPGEYKGKDNTKLILVIDTGNCHYRLTMSINKTTAKCALGGLTVADLNQPITFSFRAGDREENALICDVWQNGEKLFFENPDKVPASRLIQAIADRLNQTELIAKPETQPEASQPSGEVPQIEPELEPASTQTEPEDLSELIAQISVLMQAIHWSANRGRSHILATYGKKSRAELTHDQLVEFAKYLENLRDNPPKVL
jgi:hypothetical protein